MNIFGSILSVILLSTTGFTQSIQEAPIKPIQEQVQTPIQTAIDEANSISQSSGVNAGIVVIDRAKNNTIKTNGVNAHRQFTLESLGRLHILLYAVANDPEVSKGGVPEITSMMQGYSGEASQKMWDKYGGQQIIRDLATKYDLQETTVGDSWGTSTSSAVDIGRLLRRFLDDSSVTTDEKKFAIELLRSTNLEVSGQNFSFGLPTAMSSSITNTTRTQQGGVVAFAQGHAPSGSEPMVRSSVGVLDKNMRYIAVIMSEMSPRTSDGDADTIISQVATALTVREAIQESTAGMSSGGDGDEQVSEFIKKQKEVFGDFVS